VFYTIALTLGPDCQEMELFIASSWVCKSSKIFR